MKAKVFVCLFCFLFLFTSISNILAAENKKIQVGSEFNIADFGNMTTVISEYKYVYATYDGTWINICGFNDLSHVEFGINEKNDGIFVKYLGSQLDSAKASSYFCSYSDAENGEGGHENVYTSTNVYLIDIPLEGNPYIYLFYTNFDIEFEGVENLPSMDDDIIADPNSRLQVTYEYNEDNTECKINATIKDGAFTDKIYYSNDMPSISGQGLITKKAFPIDGITIIDNQSLFFQAEDKDGNIIATNSVSINGLGRLSEDKFSVKFEFNNNKMDFTPSISMDQYVYYSIFFKLSNSDFIESSDFNNLSENNQVENNYTYRIISTSDKEITFDIIFEIMNNKTGSICLTKSYKIRLSKYSIDSVGEGAIVGGIIGDKPSGVVGDNESIGDIDWSFSNSVNNIKDFFNNAKEFFNLVLIFINDLPSWIVAPLYTLLVFAVILFVYHLLRG